MVIEADHRECEGERERERERKIKIIERECRVRLKIVGTREKYLKTVQVKHTPLRF